MVPTLARYMALSLLDHLSGIDCSKSSICSRNDYPLHSSILYTHMAPTPAEYMALLSYRHLQHYLVQQNQPNVINRLKDNLNCWGMHV